MQHNTKGEIGNHGAFESSAQKKGDGNKQVCGGDKKANYAYAVAPQFGQDKIQNDADPKAAYRNHSREERHAFKQLYANGYNGPEYAENAYEVGQA